MTFDEIKELIDKIDNSDIRTFELSMDGAMISMSKNIDSAVKKAVMPITNNEMNTLVNIAEETFKNTASDDAKTVSSNASSEKSGKLIKSPIVGTFYSSSSPDKPSFVNIGDKVKSGDIVCIVEAMKIMNEITSDFDGEVAEILVNNEEMVEYGQPLFRIV